MPLVRASDFCRRRLPLERHTANNNQNCRDITGIKDYVEGNALRVKAKVYILSHLCEYCQQRRRRKRSREFRSTSGWIAQDNATTQKNDDLSIPHDIFSTIYTKDPELLLKLNSIEGRNLVLLTNDGPQKNGPSEPVLLHLRSKNCQCSCYSPSDQQSEHTNINNDKKENDDSFSIYVPPCIAASAGMYEYAPSTTKYAYLSILPTSKMKEYVRRADQAFIREVAKPPKMCIPPHHILSDVHDDEEENNEKESTWIQSYFLDKKFKTGKKKFNERIMQSGSIFAIIQGNSPGDAQFSTSLFYSSSSIRKKNEKLRFYEVVCCSQNDNKDNSYGSDDDTKYEEQKTIDGDSISKHCYIVSPSQTKLILLTNKSQRIPRLPSLSSTYSFYSSVMSPSSKRPTKRTLLSKNSIDSSLSISSKYPVVPHNEHSINTLVDGLLICTQQINKFQPILYVSGHDEKEIESFVQTATDRVGMRHIQVDGLAAFQYRVNPNYSQNVTGSLIHKLAGIQSSLELAHKSSPCVLHISNFDSEIGGSNSEEKKEELKRFISAIKNSLENQDQVVVILSSSEKSKMLSTVISTISPCQMIEIDYPEAYSIKLLWSDEKSFQNVRPYLNKRSTSEILFLRRQFFISKRENDEMSNCDDAALLKSIISEIEKEHPSKGTATSTNLIPNIRWEDIGGLSHVRDEIKNTIELPLKYPHLFSNHRGRSGLLLYGPPGTGKTLVAKAVATEYNLPFLSVKGPELLGTYVGESEANVREVFSSARSAARDSTTGYNSSVLFFDELDSLAPRRSTNGDSAGGGVMERVVSTLLSEMDDGGLQKGTGESEKVTVFVIGATNRPDLLDPSLLRPGRFDRLVYLGLAKSNEDRGKILIAQMRKFKFESNKNVQSIVEEAINSIPESLSGADLSSVASGALMRSIRRLCSEVESAALKRSVDGKNEASMHLDSEEWEASREDGSYQLQPIVTLQDIKEAAKNVVPSINERELFRYESIKSQIEGR